MSPRQYTGWLLALALLAAFSPAAAAPGDGGPELAAQRDIYGKALKALREGETRRYERLVAQLGDYPLKPYLEFRYLVVRRGGSHDDRIQAFLDRHRDSHLGRRLADAWMHALFQRRQYARLIAAYQGQRDVRLRCLYVRSHIRLRRPTEPLQPLIRAIWLHGKSRPKICDPLLIWFRQNGLNKELVWQRVQLSLEARNTRLARYLKRFLPKAEQPWVDLWIQVHRNPQRHLKSRRLRSPNRHSRAIVAYGITSLSRQQPEAAYRWYEKYRKAGVLDSAQVQNLRHRIAISAASDGLPIAHALMAATPPYLRNETFRHMRLRLALHERNWWQVLEAARDLPDAYPYDRMGQYWQARALKRLGRSAESVELFEQLARHRGYYGFLAAERINQPHAMNYAPTPPEMSRAQPTPALLRAREFYHHRDIMNAREEWQDLIAQGDASLLNLAATVASRWEWHEAVIRAFGGSRYYDDLKLRFPRPYAGLFERQAERNRVDASLLFAISRRESAFAADTRSPVGAIGLMQLMPGTARQVARALNLKRPRTTSLKQPELNIVLGSQYLADMLRRYGGNPAMALAAYNAGPTAVDQWRPGFETDADIWIDTIPFHETRRYVRTVLEYAAIYQWQANRASAPIWPQIQPIRPPS